MYKTIKPGCHDLYFNVVFHGIKGWNDPDYRTECKGGLFLKDIVFALSTQHH